MAKTSKADRPRWYLSHAGCFVEGPFYDYKDAVVRAILLSERDRRGHLTNTGYTIERAANEAEDPYALRPHDTYPRRAMLLSMVALHVVFVVALVWALHSC